jgi:hypothetical protein
VRINCHLPITVRIVGVPTDDQLAAIGRTVFLALTARLAEAERMLAGRYAVSGRGPARVIPSGDRPAAELPRDPADRDPAMLSDAAPTRSGELGSDAEGVVFRLAAEQVAPAGTGSAATSRDAGGATSAALAPQADLIGGAARFDVGGQHRQEERSQTLWRGGNPDESPPPTMDPLAEALREATRNPPPRQPDPIVPGRPGQQKDTIEEVIPAALWLLPRVQDKFSQLARYMEDWERHRRKPNLAYNAEYWLDFWHQRFVASLRHIIYYRGYRRDDVGAKNMYLWHLNKLVKAEQELVRKNPPPSGHLDAFGVNAAWAAALSAQVESLRRAALEDWLRDVDVAVDRFLVLADNQAKFLTVKQDAKPVLVKGLPTIEPNVLPAQAKGVLEPGSPGSASTAVVLIRELQKQWHGRKVLAENYGGHEFGNPFFGPREWLGKFSFDVHLDEWVGRDSQTGFYEHAGVVDFFKALEQASQETQIGWLAWYNDFSVAKEINEWVGQYRIGFSGGGSPRNPSPEQEGSFHHGPEPYVLHIHINVIYAPWGKVVLHGKDARPMNLGYPGD